MVAFAGLTQKQEEQLALDQFRRGTGLLPGIDKPVEQDPPDFVITNGGRRTSVETTRYHKQAGEDGSKDAERESNEQLLVSRAQRIFEAEHPDLHLEVRVHMVPASVTRPSVRIYAPMLARAAAVLAPPEPTGTVLVNRIDVFWPDLPEAKLQDVVNHLDIARWRPERWKPGTSSVWPLGWATMMSNDIADLKSRIRVKEQDLDDYGDQYNERWLLIYTMPLASASFDFEVLHEGMFTSRFDGVAFGDVFTGKSVVIARR